MNNERKKTRVLNELYRICTDSDAKPGDRISAAKLFLDNAEMTKDENDTLRVIFEGIDEDYLK